MKELDFLATDDLDELLGGETPPKPVVVVSPVNPVLDLSDTDPALKDDLNASRTALRQQQEMMMQLATMMAPEVAMAEHPKMIEAFAKLMAQITSSAKALVDVHKVTKDTKAVPTVVKQTNQQINAEKVFIGTHSDLMDELGTRQDEQEKEIEGQRVDYDPEADRASS
ncbi:Terminase DNA packaging enzyme [compost metagenome]